ncbi:MAG: VOC family protein [Sphaerobacteraceae bacterium]|nr:MAG: VOC family protein [Sphaerobacteraceae bacterium]
MPQADRPVESTRIHPQTDVGQLRLTVSDLNRSIGFYADLIGLRLISKNEAAATLGVGEVPLLVLDEQPGAEPWPRGVRSYPGLYHFAILVPTRADLGRWLTHWLRQDMPLPGQGDHFVSEALYLEDPDGHGIEIYRDRPRIEWEWQDGQVRMGVEPVDIRGLLEAAEQARDPWTGMPPGTTLGHIHLQVTDIEATATFYRDILGFDIVARMPSALFMSAGGYHHHIGANIWHSRNAEPAPAEHVQLVSYSIVLPNRSSFDQVLERLKQAGIPVDTGDTTATLRDPTGIELQLTVQNA